METPSLIKKSFLWTENFDKNRISYCSVGLVWLALAKLLALIPAVLSFWFSRLNYPWLLIRLATRVLYSSTHSQKYARPLIPLHTWGTWSITRHTWQVDCGGWKPSCLMPSSPRRKWLEVIHAALLWLWIRQLYQDCNIIRVHYWVDEAPKNAGPRPFSPTRPVTNTK